MPVNTVRFENPVPPASSPDVDAVHVETCTAIAPGEVLAERYRVLELAGAGGMGEVYLCEHLTVGRKVALKVLLPEWSAVPEVANRFAAEAHTASAIGHPGIIDVFDAGRLPDGRLFLAMEYIEGTELGDLIAQHGPLPPLDACQIVRAVADAIAAAHEADIVHRDLKPENIMVVERNGERIIKVLDFGVASRRISQHSVATIPGMVIGTPDHMSPEQSLGAPAEPHFDIYALGSILFTLIAGRSPFDDPNPHRILAQKQTQSPPNILDFSQGLPDTLRELITVTVAREIELRPTSAMDFIGRLDTAIADLQTHRASPGTQLKRKMPWLLGGGVTLAAVLTAFGVTLKLKQPSASTQRPASTQAATSNLSKPLDPANVETQTPSNPREAQAPPSLDTTTSSASSNLDLPPSESSTLPSLDTAEEPKTKPTSEPKAKPTSKPKAKSKQKDAAHTTEACAKVRDQAHVARDSFHWATLRNLAQKRRCWTNSSEARKLETQARMELRDFEGCLKASKGLRDTKTLRWRELCKKRGGL